MSPEPEAEEEEVPADDDEEVDASFTGEYGAASGKKGALAKEVFHHRAKRVDALGFESPGEELCSVCARV